MTYSKEILDDIAEDAKQGLSLQEIAIRLNVPYDTLHEDYCAENSDIKRFYDYGQAKGKSLTDAQLFKLSQNGSVSAKMLYDKKMLTAQLTNIYREIDEV